jgi:uncharacterized protein YggE
MHRLVVFRAWRAVTGMLMLAPLWVSARSQASVVGSSSGGPPQIVATGRGEANVTPDRAVIQVAVQTRGTLARSENVASIAADNVKAQRTVLDTLLRLGLKSSQVTMAGYRVQPEYLPGSGPPGTDGQRSIAGYTVTTTFRVEVTDIALLGRVIDAVLARGAVPAGAPYLFASKTDEARKQALDSAVAHARADAEAVARAAGGSLGSLLEVWTGETPTPLRRFEQFYPNTDFSGMGAGGGLAASRLESIVAPQSLTIAATVTARWQFVPASR